MLVLSEGSRVSVTAPVTVLSGVFVCGTTSVSLTTYVEVLLPTTVATLTEAFSVMVRCLVLDGVFAGGGVINLVAVLLILRAVALGGGTIVNDRTSDTDRVAAGMRDSVAMFVSVAVAVRQ